ncbi:MAG TPA: transposase [Acidimicrobiales bacterium]|nr:transposase [Acidimicrobiales bacterium]
MSNRTRHHRLSRGDRRRNEKLARLREVVARDLAIVGIDLADARQVAVVADHDSRVLGKRSFAGSAWVAADILAWAEPVARAAGFGGVVLACEPTGHRWKPVLQVAREAGVGMVCVQPLLVHRAREGEDFTKDRSDPRDATIISRLAAELRCYVPVAEEGGWARLRHLGQRRAGLVTQATAARQALRDLLACGWPAALGAAAKPLGSTTWRAAMAACQADPAVVRAMDEEAFLAAVGAEVPRWGAKRRNLRIARAIYAAAWDPGGLEWEAEAACERASFALSDWARALDALVEVEAAMVATLDDLGLTPWVTTIPGLSAPGAAAILAETGDPARYDCARTWVKHAGLCPRANESGAYRGQTTVSGRGRPNLRTAAWRAIWGALPHNSVYRARYAHLTTRSANPLTPAQARAALAGSLLRQLYVVVTARVAWDPATASGATREEVAA